MNFDIPEAQLVWQRSVRKLVDEQLRPFDQEIEATGQIPDEAILALREARLFGVNTPESFGGLGHNMFGTCLAIQELAKAHIAYYYHCGINLHIGSKAIEFFGTQQQREVWLPQLATGETVSAFALTESEAGSDAAGIQTTAIPDGDGYRLNGTKRFITNAPIAGVFTVFATVEPGSRRKGVTAFLVDARTRGLRIGELSRMSGGRGSLHAEVHFDDCLISRADRIGEEGQGIEIALACLDAGRTVWAAYAVGVAEHLLAMAIDHLRTRKQFGRPLIENQGLQWRLADLVSSLHAARLSMYEAAWRYDADPGSRRSGAALSKLVCTEMACRVADDVMQFFGGIGYSLELPVERFWRDVRACRILDGTSEILRSVIARDLDRWIDFAGSSPSRERE